MRRASKRVVLRTVVWLGLGCLYALPFLNVQGAFDAFLKIDGVPGESTDSSHFKWIDIRSFHHGVSQPAGGVQSAGAVGLIPTEPTAKAEPLTISKPLDCASPKLMLSCCNGEPIGPVQLELVRPSDRRTFYKITLSDVIVSSVSPGGSSGGDQVPTEQVSLNFGKIEVEYDYIDPVTGAVTPIRTFWDFVSNSGGEILVPPPPAGE